MALTDLYPMTLEFATCYSPSVGATPVVGYMTMPFRGYIVEFGSVLGGTITTANATVTVADGTTSTTIGTFTIVASGSAGGTVSTGNPSSIVLLQEDDCITFTSASASGSSIPATFFAKFAKG